MSRKRFKVPLDTLGHPLPPPVTSNATCKIPSREWGKWWEKYYTNTLPEEKDCCVCGYWFETKLLTALDTELVEHTVQRQYLNGMMTKNIFLCPGCRKKCFSCSQFIPEAQKTLFNNHCRKCFLASGAEKSRKKQKPSGR
jgi:hypothetical protein